ncbi:hypothetical protein HII17_14290 [Thalassotalea sp. M1531]|uniref:Uncharacterized protein n=1 Tax=Thalassotalea algicola TaxID=2716224 RepID=A0A7Y0LDU6_9GAMM|nr:hypothetical protein [Thalassotalea algicola]NMP32728.1 hypothetical protein [Thalassotalea algicola]
MKNVIIFLLAMVVIYLIYENYLTNEIDNTVSDSKLNAGLKVIVQKEKSQKPEPLAIKNRSFRENSNFAPELKGTSSNQSVNLLPKINSKLCLDDNGNAEQDGCEINLALNIESAIIDQHSGSVSSSDALSILESSNFSNVLNNLASRKVEHRSFENEILFNSELNGYLNNHDESIQSDGIFCGDTICAAEFSFEDIEHMNDLSMKLLQSPEKGHVFLNFNISADRQGNKIARVLFLQNNSGGVVLKEKGHGE